MTTHRTRRARTRSLVILPIALSSLLAACGPAGGSSAIPATVPATRAPASAAASQAPDSGTAGGDVPDNAVFLTYQDPKLGFAIQYVEGWQVAPSADGVTIHDKDSSEVVRVVGTGSDVPAYVDGTDLPALRSQQGFEIITRDTITVGGRPVVHLRYHLPAPPDPVTGKQVPSTLDRFYVGGSTGIAVVTLSTPDGVDNVDAFRQMIESFTWA